MTLEKLFNICRTISYAFKGIFGCALVALLMFDPDRSVHEYVPTTYAILFGTLVITGPIMYILHDITRLTRWIEPILVCLLAAVAEAYAIIFKKVPPMKTLRKAYEIYVRCRRSIWNTFVTCVKIYTKYADEQLSKTRRQWRNRVGVHLEYDEDFE